MSEDWSSVADEVAAGLADAGATAFIVRDGTQTGPDWNPTFGPPMVHACTVVYSRWSRQEIDGTLIQATDLKILVDATSLGFEPAPEHKFKRAENGPDMSIISATPLAPAGEAVMWTLQVRA